MIKYIKYHPRFNKQCKKLNKSGAKAKKALEFYRPDQLFLNTDCGFACFSSRSVNVEQVAYEKLCAIVEAANILREKYK